MEKLITVYWLASATLGWCVFALGDELNSSFYGINAGGRYGDALVAIYISAFFLFIGFRLTDLSRRKTGLGAKNIIAGLSSQLDSGLIMFVVFVLALLSSVGYLMSYGLSDLLFRNYYLPVERGIWPIISQISSFLGMVATFILFFSRRNRRRWIALLFSLVFFFLMFSKGSRIAVISFAILAMAPMFIFFRRSPRWFKVIYSLSVVLLCIPLMYALLYFRGYSEYGFVAFMGRVPEAMDSLVSDSGNAFWIISGNLAFILPVTAVTIQQHHNFNQIWVALSPLPSFLTDWGVIGPTRRVSFEIPYNSIGELYGFSPLLCSGYMFFAGAIFGWCRKFGFRMTGRLKIFYFVIFFALFLLFGLLISQYNLRSATRIIYYQMLMSFIFFMASGFLVIKNARK